MRKRYIALLVVMIGLGWILWPIYGFVSQQYEIARSPLGWTDLPVSFPVDQALHDQRYKEAARKSVEAIEARRAKLGAPSLSAAVAVEGKLVWAGAVGWQSLEDRISATPDTVYRIGSTSKAVTATGLALAVKQGLVSLDTPISQYKPDLPNGAWQAMTLRQLSSHTAGLAAYEENNDWIGFYQSLALNTQFTTATDSLSVVDGSDVLFEPGTDFHYSGFDNILIAAILESASGLPFDHYMEERLFVPNSLNIVPDHDEKVARRAVSYQRHDDTAKPWRSVDLSHKLAAGGFAATPSALAQLGALWLLDDFVSSELREDFWTPVKLSNGQTNEQNYALGWRRSSWPIEGFGEIEHLNHGGVSKGAQCWLMIVPDQEIVVAISINQRTDEFFDFADVYVDILEAFLVTKAQLSDSEQASEPINHSDPA